MGGTRVHGAVWRCAVPQCSATSKQSGEQCRRMATPGRTVCHFHGGRSLVGPANPAWKHGRYSESVPANLRQSYETARQDPDLAALREELAVVTAHLDRMLAQMQEAEGTPEYYAAWERWYAASEHRRKLALAEHRRMEVLSQMMPAEQVLALLDRVVRIIGRHADRQTLGLIAADVERLLESGNAAAL